MAVIPNEVKMELKVNIKLTLWSAIKMRIAGIKNFTNNMSNEVKGEKEFKIDTRNIVKRYIGER
jgi:phage-related protein